MLNVQLWSSSEKRILYQARKPVKTLIYYNLA